MTEVAVVAFTTYSTAKDCGRTNIYIADGHGSSPQIRTNRYISDGHGGRTVCQGHLCPCDPILATAYMEAKRWNYERQHSVSTDRTKGHVTHVQLYISPTEEDRVPPDERMEMTRELIERTALRDFPAIYIAHDNTRNGHCHISLCPYSEDGSHKLCVNNKLIFDLRRELDQICVEHGYSIIECPELWGDRSYWEWFQQVKEQGKITIHPPRDLGRTCRKQGHKRSRDYFRSKQDQKKRKEEREQYFKEITSSYSPEKDAYFYTSEFLYSTVNPMRNLRIKRITLDGNERSEMELRAASLGIWANNCMKTLEKKAIPGTETIYNRMKNVCERAYEAKCLMESLDIRTVEEFVFHICECGQDIGTLKREIKLQEEAIQRLQPTICAAEKWKGEQDTEAYADLYKQNCSTPAQLAEVKKECARALAKKESYGLLLEERSKEYRLLKTAEKTLDPISSKDAWESYLETMFSKNKIIKVKRIPADDLERRIYELGKILGVPGETIDQYLIEAAELADRLRYDEEPKRAWRDYKNRLFGISQQRQRDYKHYTEEMAFVENLWDLRNQLAGFGLLGFLLSAVIEAWAEMEQSITQFELDLAMCAALLEKLYVESQYRNSVDGTNYHPEVHKMMDKEAHEAAKRVQKMINDVVESRKEKQEEKNSMVVQQEKRRESLIK